jgi:hypothetical protein
VGASWSRLILWTAVALAVLQAIVVLAHVDREAIVFAVLFAIGVGILLRTRVGSRVYTATAIVLGLLFADVAFWMISARLPPVGAKSRFRGAPGDPVRNQ